MRKRIRRAKTLRWIAAAGLFLLAAAALGYAIREFGGFELQLQLNGEREYVLKLGETFEDPYAAASFRGSMIFKEPITVPVTSEGTVDTSRVGVHQMIYRARYGLWIQEAVRTVRVVDQVRPRIILLGNTQSWYRPGQSYQEEGYVARDNYDGDLTDQVQVTYLHNQAVYTVSDSSGNRTETIRPLVCYDPVFPELQLIGAEHMTIDVGKQFEDPGCTAFDNLEGDISQWIQVKGSVDPYHAGVYVLRYSVEDSYGNRTTVSRTVEVLSGVRPEVIVPEGKVIYLTFDDGPGPYTRELLGILRKYDVKATFFVIDNHYADLIKEIAQDGHSLGIHSVSHDYEKIYASETAYVEDLLKMQEIIEAHSGIRTTLVRFPGGSSNTVSCFNDGIMTRLTKLVDEMGFQYFDWNVNSGDAGQTKSSKKVAENVIEGVKSYDVSIVLQHDIKKYSVEAVEEIILWALEHGYRFLPLDSTSPNAHHQVRN